nr:hypothetical protein [Paenibacillus tianmuensis]
MSSNKTCRRTWSPEQIAEKRRVEGKPFFCFKTIYRWLYEGRLAVGDIQMLLQKGKRRKRVEILGRFLVVTPIRFENAQRSVTGSSTPSSPAGAKARTASATFIGRKKRLYMALNMPDWLTRGRPLFGILVSQYPKGTFQKATTDPGKEFVC